jgi:hypothetical protein
MTKVLQYGEGTWFAVPLRTGGFGVGRIVRANAKAGIHLGYFFGLRLDQIPTLRSLENMQPSEAILIARFGHFGLRKGTWPIIGSSVLARDQWRVPQFVRRDLLNGRLYKVTYSADDPAEEIDIQPISSSEAVHLPEDGTFGHGAIEIRLAKLLANPKPEGNP